MLLLVAHPFHLGGSGIKYAHARPNSTLQLGRVGSLVAAKGDGLVVEVCESLWRVGKWVDAPRPLVGRSLEGIVQGVIARGVEVPGVTVQWVMSNLDLQAIIVFDLDVVLSHGGAARLLLQRGVS